MVVFNCGQCGEALKKNQVDKHLTIICRRVQTLSCIDCGKDFDREGYKTHIKCVSEQEKYGGANYMANSNVNKGEKKNKMNGLKLFNRQSISILEVIKEKFYFKNYKIIQIRHGNEQNSLILLITV